MAGAEPITAVVERALYASHDCGKPIGTMTYIRAFLDQLRSDGYEVASRNRGVIEVDVSLSAHQAAALRDDWETN